jgi:hypothetical protein
MNVYSKDQISEIVTQLSDIEDWLLDKCEALHHEDMAYVVATARQMIEDMAYVVATARQMIDDFYDIEAKT